MKSNLLEEIIEEELGVSNEVIEISKKYLKEIETQLKAATNEDKGNFILSSINFPFYMYDSKITTTVYYRNFKDKDCFNFHKGYDYIKDGFSVMVSPKLFFCTLNIYAISGHLVTNEAIDTIQHEVEHIFQQKKMGKRFGGIDSYLMMRDDKESSNESRNKIGDLIYTIDKTEQKGYINGLYASMMDCPKNITLEDIYNSDAYKNYQRGCEIFKELKISKELQDIFLKYGMSYLDIEDGLHNFLRRIARVYLKIRNDKIKQGWR